MIFIPAASTFAGIFTEGHGDIAVCLSGDALVVGINLEGGLIDGSAVSDFLPLSDVQIFVPASTREPRPANFLPIYDLDPVGVNEGTDIYTLPASATQALLLQTPLLGFGTYLLDGSDFLGNVVFTLTNFAGPAGTHFSIYQDAFPGPNFFVTTSNGLNASDSISLPLNAHDHFNFVFTQRGIYELEFTVTATHRDLGLLTSTARATLSVTTTIPEFPTLPLTTIGLLTGAVLRYRKRG